jgi:uncharacterized protein YoxC
MLFWLTWISIALAVVYVVVLAITLITVAYHVLHAASTATKLADGLEAVDTQTRKLPEYMTTINGALVKLRDGLTAVDSHLANVARAAGLE